MKRATTSETPEGLTKTGAGCMSVAAFPFLALGVGMLIFAFTLHRQGRSNAPGAALFGGIALAMGLIILMLIRWLFAHGQRVRQRAAEHPDEPWLWKPQWAQRSIRDSGTSSAVFAWIFAGIWNAVSWPAIVALIRGGDLKRDPGFYFVFLFPLIGLAVIGLAIHLTLRRLKFGRSVFELETLPGAIGGWLAGTIETGGPIFFEQGVRLTLRCINRVTTGHGKQRRVTDHPLWKDEQLLTGRLPASKAGGSSIPVAFRIPADCRPTHDGDRNDILWRLSANAQMSGADYQADFVVPVFAVTQPESFVPRTEATESKFRSAEFARQSTEADLDVVTDAAGRMRFNFPARRRRGSAITCTIVALVFSCVSYVIFAFDGPVFFAVLTALIAALCYYGSIVFWFRQEELRVDHAGVQRVRCTLGFTRTRTIPGSDAKLVRFKETTQVNDNSYFSVFLDTNDGKSVHLVSGLELRDARGLSGQVARAIGVEAKHER